MKVLRAPESLSLHPGTRVGWSVTRRRLRELRGLGSLAGLLFFCACTAASVAPMESHHRLTVRLVPDAQRLEGLDRITVRPTKVETLRLRLSPGAEIERIAVDGQTGEFSTDGGVTTVRLPATTRRAGVTLVVTYRAVFKDPVPESPVNTEDPSYGVVGTITSQGTFLDAGASWYPDVADSRQDFRVRVEAPRGVEAVTQGKRTDRGVDGDTSYSVWEVSEPLSGLSLAAGPYVVGERDSGGVPVYTYLYSQDADLSDKYLEAVVGYLSLYRELLGPYPFEKFAVVENFFPTGYGFPSFTLLGKQLIRLPFILGESLGHEIAHSWWGNGVLVDYRAGNWSEGLTTYVSDYLYRERRSEAEARQYRLNILRDYATLVPPSEDFPLRAFTSRDSPASRVIGYGKGAMVFHMVRQTIGDKAFWKALRSVVREKLFQKASWDDFRNAFNRTGSTDLTAFFRQWVDRPGAPVLTLGGVHLRSEDSRWVATGSLFQKRPFFDLRVPLALEADGKADSEVVPLREGSSHIRLAASELPQKLVVDPDANLFRRLDPIEVPPTVNSIRGSTSLRVVAAKGLGEKTLAACRVLLEGMGLGSVPVVPEAGGEESRGDGGDVLYLGWPGGGAGLPPLPEGVSASSGGFSVEGRRYDRPGDALFVALRRSEESGQVVALFLPLSADAARAAAPKVPHYGKYSYLAFRDGKNEAKGTWPVTESPTIYHFADQGPPLSANDQILDLSTGKITRLPDILGDLEDARLVFVGELHDRKWHHWAQLQVIRSLYSAGISLAIGLEMFQHRYQWALDHWVAGDLPEEDFLPLFATNWDLDYWPVYRNIFLYARQHWIPMVGLNLPREISDKVAMEGFAALTSAQLAQLPQIESCNVGPEYRGFIQRALGDSGHQGITFDHFCEAQLLWDSTMAKNLLAYLGTNPSRHVVVMAGSGHSWKKGIPAQIRKESSVPIRVILPEMPGRLSREEATVDDADYLWLNLTPGDH